MEQKVIVTIVIIVIIIIVIVSMMTMTEQYCNCTGMATAFNRAPYTFWKGAQWKSDINPTLGVGWQANAGMPYLNKNGGYTTPYTMGPSELTDLYRDQVDGLLGDVNNSSLSVNNCSTNQHAFALGQQQQSTYQQNTCGSCCGSGYGNTPQLVSLQTLGASPPITSVSYNNGVTNNLKLAPPGTCRFGGYQTGCGGSQNTDNLTVSVL